MKRLISVMLALSLLLGSCCTASASVTLQGEKGSVTYSYKTVRLIEYADSSVNPYDSYGLRIKQTIPNYLGTIEADLETSEGSGRTDVVVIYVPNEKWDGDCYYNGITATVNADPSYHIYEGAETIVGWKEWYNYGFLPIDGGIYIYDKDAVQLNFLEGPGLYTGYAALPFSDVDTGTESFEQAYMADPAGVYMTALGYPFILILDDETIAYYMEHGTLNSVASYDWPNLAPLLEEQKYVSQEGGDIGLQNFVKKNSYYNGKLVDLIGSEAWFMPYAAKVYETGLMIGNTSAKFMPDSNISLAEAITVAARINDIYYGGSGEFTPGRQWYSVSLNYAIGKGIIKEGDFDGEYNRSATRGEIAYIFSHVLPAAEYNAVKKDIEFSDVTQAHDYYPAVSRLGLAGIIDGYNDGNFRPDECISRAEIAAIVCRIIDKDMRKAGR